MRYEAGADIVAGEYYAEVQASTAANVDIAERHARAMKAVLLAVRAWGRSCRAENPSVDLEAKMLAAVNRLAKIEEEVDRV